MKIKGFMIDSARCLERRGYYKDLIRFCAGKGMNALLWHFSDDQGTTLDFPSIPGLGEKNAYDAGEMRELVAFAADHGVTLIPELETLGHSRFLTRHPDYRHLSESDEAFTAVCPLHPETRAVMRTLLKDVAEIFPSKWIHVGMDEVNLGGHPLTREALKTRSADDIFVEYARFLHAEVQALGREMIMWVDPHSYNSEVMSLLPRSIIAAVWQYSPDASPALPQELLDLGFNVLLCPAVVSYHQQAYPGDWALPNIRKMSSYQSLTGKGEVQGIVATIWAPQRLMHNYLWPALTLTAEQMSTEGRTGVKDAMAIHLRDFHAAVPTLRVIDALCDCFELAPRRKEYLGILKGKDVEITAAHAEDRCARWTAVARELERFQGEIRKEQTAYDTLRLFASLMAYLYRRAAVIVANSGSSILPAEIRDEGLGLLEKLEAVWDAERFPDDRRKREPVFDWEADEYLVVNFRKSLSA